MVSARSSILTLRDQGSALGASVPLAASLRRTRHRHHSSGVSRSRDRFQGSLAPSNPPLVFHLLPWGENASVAPQRRPGYSTRASDEAGARHCHSPGGRAASPLRAPRRLTAPSIPSAPAGMTASPTAPEGRIALAPRKVSSRYSVECIELTDRSRCARPSDSRLRSFRQGQSL